MYQRKLRIAGINPESIVDGPGIRWTVFTQGCPHECPGCHNPGTWSMSGGREVSVQELLTSIRNNPLLDGITLSGGEPLVQAEACLNLCLKVKQMGLSVWLYTGYTFEWIMSDGSEAQRMLVAQADVLVDGRFILEERSLELFFRGSKNQRLIDIPKTMSDGTIVLWVPPLW